MIDRNPLTRAVCAAAASVCLAAAPAAASIATLVPTQDTFALADDPFATYGFAGGLNVSGAAATNGNGVAQGVTETWIMFEAASAVAQFDAAYGAGNWNLVSATLSLNEVATPNNPVFNRGVGDFEITWLDSDDWTEGSGSPSLPGTATGNEIGYAYGQSILDVMADESLGVFSNAVADGRQDFALTPTAGFAADVAAAGLLSLHLTPVDAGVGFTFNAGTGANGPQLILEADLVPGAPTVALLGLAGLARARRRRGRGGPR